jgi:hypothetical protein
MFKFDSQNFFFHFKKSGQCQVMLFYIMNYVFTACFDSYYVNMRKHYVSAVYIMFPFPDYYENNLIMKRIAFASEVSFVLRNILLRLKSE